MRVAGPGGRVRDVQGEVAAAPTAQAGDEHGRPLGRGRQGPTSVPEPRVGRHRARVHELGASGRVARDQVDAIQQDPGDVPE